jgi:hypothetical protein
VVLALAHRVLVVAEQRQGVLDEVVQGAQRVVPRDREPERLQIPEPVAEPPAHELQHLAGGLVRVDARRPGRGHAGGQPLPVLRVVVPAAALGLAGGGHQDAGVAAQRAVERVHPRLRPLGGPAREGVGRAEEARVGPDLDRHADRLLPAPGVLEHPPLARPRDDDPPGFVPSHGAPQLAAEGPAVAGIVEGDVVDRDPLGAQPGREVAHRREQERDLLRVVRDVVRLGRDLGHQHHVAGRVEPVQGRHRPAQVVREQEAQGAAAGHVPDTFRAARRMKTRPAREPAAAAAPFCPSAPGGGGAQ